jgi:Right handed beta helix region
MESGDSKALRLGMVAVTTAAVLLALAPVASGATFVPTRFDDPPPGRCKPANCSLREALDAANDDSDRDTIRLAEGTYEIEIPHVAGQPANETGDLSPSYPTTIKGQGPKQTKVDANGLDRVFLVGSILAEDPVRFQSLTMKGGDPTVISDPQHPAVGGGIYAYTESVVLKDVAIRKNEALDGGGARLQVTSLKIVNSTISGNSAGEGGGIQFPSAIFEAPVASIRGTTISGNSATRGGGLIADGYHPNPQLYPPQVTFLNSTIDGNRSSGDGGGILAEEDASLILDNTTVAHNLADDDNSGGGSGGGIRQLSGAAFGLDDALIAQNAHGPSGGGSQCSGLFQGSGGVVVQLQAGTSCTVTGTIPIEPTDPLVGPLAANGGPTKTVALLSGSDAIGAADSCPPKDQRGKPRPSVDCDSGAFERKGP